MWVFPRIYPGRGNRILIIAITFHQICHSGFSFANERGMPKHKRTKSTRKSVPLSNETHDIKKNLIQNAEICHSQLDIFILLYMSNNNIELIQRTKTLKYSIKIIEKHFASFKFVSNNTNGVNVLTITTINSNGQNTTRAWTELNSN